MNTSQHFITNQGPPPRVSDCGGRRWATFKTKHTAGQPTRTCVGAETPGEHAERQHGVDEGEQTGRRGVGSEQSGRVGGQEAVRHAYAVGGGAHGRGHAQVAPGAVACQADFLPGPAWMVRGQWVGLGGGGGWGASYINLFGLVSMDLELNHWFLSLWFCFHKNRTFFLLKKIIFCSPEQKIAYNSTYIRGKKTKFFLLLKNINK